MAALTFHKYQGTGNDFVLIDDRAETFPLADSARVARLCDRRFGIGADGLILLRLAAGYDFRMVYFNADGRESTLCGNGSRCLVRFAQYLGLISDRATFLAADGPHEATLTREQVQLQMNNVIGITSLPEGHFVDTGSPHLVRFVDNLADCDVFDSGRRLRYHEQFQPGGGTNVNFVSPESESTLFVRTYERGVEAETYSCGTGVTAVALVASQRGFASPVHLRTPGGRLSVTFQRQADGSFTDIWLSGPAEKVFEGTVDW